MRKTFQFTNNQMFVTLYKTMVRPVIEYGNSAGLGATLYY